MVTDQTCRMEEAVATLERGYSDNKIATRSVLAARIEDERAGLRAEVGKVERKKLRIVNSL